MRKSQIIFYLIILCLSLTVKADQTKQSGDDYLKSRLILERIEDVQKVIGHSLDPRLALQISLCSDMAAHPSDPNKYGKGIDFKNIKPKEAIKNCQNAYNNGGSKYGLVLTSLSRAFNKAENYTESFKYAKRAVTVDYPFADVMMAIHFEYGDGVKKNKQKEFSWYKKAAEKGITSAMRTTANNYLKGHGTKVYDGGAYFWATRAIEAKDGKAFYELGLVLEKISTNHSKSSQLLSLAKQSYEIAKTNFVSTKKDIKRVSKLLHPNTIADDSVLFTKTVVGRKIDGIFFPLEVNSNWYIGEKPLHKDNNTYLYARTSYNNSIFTLWYKNAKRIQDSGWYIDFFYAGNKEIKGFDSVSVISKIDGKTNYIDLDLADSKVQPLPGSYRLAGRISFRDVQLLQRGTQLKIYYRTEDRTPTYTMALNDKNNHTGENINLGANKVISELISSVKPLNESCCKAPDIVPLSERYTGLYKLCSSRTFDRSFSKKIIRQDCHQILKNAKDEFDLITEPHKTHLSNVLKAVDELVDLNK